MMVRMRLATLALIVSLAGATLLAQAAFDPRMNLWRLEKEARALREAGQSVDAVAVTALEAKVEAGKATAAMVIAGYAPHSVVRAMLAAGAFPTPVCAGLLVAGLRIEEARGYFDVSATGQPEACPPTLFSGGGTSPADVTVGASGTGGGTEPTSGVSGTGGGGGGPIGSSS
jgi:hypothetical protein